LKYHRLKSPVVSGRCGDAAVVVKLKPDGVVTGLTDA